jgi:uncharacterized membrane protein
MKKFDRYDGLSLLLVAGMFGGAVWARGAIPGPIPTHFGLDGHPNGWSSGWFGLLALPGASLLLFAWLRLGTALLPAQWRERMEASPVSVATAAVVAVLGAVQAISFYVALHPKVAAGGPISVALGALSVGVGLLYPKLRRNPWMGVRTAWTLSSDENWARTHRFGGLTAVAGGLVAIAVGFFSPQAAIAAFMLGLAAPLVYSFVLARQLAEDR